VTVHHNPILQSPDLAIRNTRTRRWAVPGVVAVAAVAVIGVAQPASEVGATKPQTLLQRSIDDAPQSAPIVVGTGPKAVYVGPAPTFGGDPARGETDDSYFARTGRHLPGLSTAAVVDGPWWYGRAPIVGGDPASGETEDSYFARTGRHLPAP
jgi:hypothetical protein